MPVIGITGGIATGKTSFCAAVAEISGGRFFDADESARRLSETDEEVRELITAAFGTDAFLNGHLNRALIRTMVFADAEKKRALEQILHPRIRRQWSLEAERRRHSAELFFADIPLLYETSGETLCDRIVVVACSADVQLDRLMQRSSLGRGAAETMIASQLPLVEKIRRADHVVWNNGPRGIVVEQARALVRHWTS